MCNETSVKESIISSFCLQSSPLWIVIATIAFGLGLDSPFVRQVIHWEPLKTVQEMGHCGRDGKLARSLLLFAIADRQYTKKGMIKYCKNTVQCRRNLFYQDLDDADTIAASPTTCTSCDVCAERICGHCKEVFSNYLLWAYIYCIVSFLEYSIHCWTAFQSSFFNRLHFRDLNAPCFLPGVQWNTLRFQWFP